MATTQTSYPIIRLGTRNSPLAMAQAYEVRSRLCSAHGWPQEAVELVPVVASGDKVLDRPLADIGGKALWTKELDRWLDEGKIDGAVHSAKDVETIRPPQFAIAAVLPRADRRDVLIGAKSIDDLPDGAVVGTSAPRRAAQLLSQRPDCKVVMFRGNVATRLAKLKSGEADATFLAAAGLQRLGQDDVGVPLETAQWLPAAGQGAIIVEALKGGEAATALDVLNDHDTRAELMVERALLAGLGGTCHSPVAAQCLCVGDGLVLRAALYSEDGSECVEDEINVARGDLGAAQTLARDLLKRASPAINRLFGSSV